MEPDAACVAVFPVAEAEFTYFDMTQNSHRRIRAICSQNYHGDGKCYVMLYNLDAKEPEVPGPKVRMRTFGYFDVFVDDKPIPFRNEKSKELFALLVDRRGGFVFSEEAISFLWEDESTNSVTLARYRKVALRPGGRMPDTSGLDPAGPDRQRILKQRNGCRSAEIRQW